MAMFKNGQWAVTEEGLCSRRPNAPKEIAIDAGHLLDRDAGGDLYDWPLVMAGKAWIDIEDFVEAYVEALEVHAGRYPGEPDPERLEASFAEARRIAAEREDSRWV